MSPFLCILGASELDSELQMCLTQAEKRGRITCHNLLAVLFLKYSHGCCWLYFCMGTLLAHVQHGEAVVPKNRRASSQFQSPSRVSRLGLFQAVVFFIHGHQPYSQQCPNLTFLYSTKHKSPLDTG